MDGALNDGIVLGRELRQYKPSGTLADAILQVEAVRIGPAVGETRGETQDCLQHYGGWKDLRVDRLTCTTSYQGFYLPWEDGQPNNQGVLSHFDLRHANLSDSPPNGASFQTLLHFGGRNGSFNATTHQQRGHLGNVWLSARQRSFDQETYPNSGTQSSDGTVITRYQPGWGRRRGREHLGGDLRFCHAGSATGGDCVAGWHGELGMPTKPRLLDLFCGAGGAAMGYHRAGFEVVGSTSARNRTLSVRLHQADVFAWPLGDEFDAIHASPPCGTTC